VLAGRASDGSCWHPSLARPANKNEMEFVVNSPRLIRLIRRPDDLGVGVFAITKNHRTYYYVFKEIRCDIGGRGFAVHRLGLANLYHVRVGTPRQSSCECLGFLSRGRCKHVQGLAALIGHALL
jgi:hypothetical protein